MPNSVIIHYALSGDTPTQGFTARGVYTASGNATITLTLNGTSKTRSVTAGTDADWSITFDPNTPSTGTGDLAASISGSGATGDQSEDVEVMLSGPLEDPVLTDAQGERARAPAAAGFYTASGVVNDAGGVLIVCLVQRLRPKSKQPRTLFATTAQVVNLKWSARIQVPAPVDNKQLVLRTLLINRNSKVIGTVTILL